jgi:hypothetical protein
MTVYATYNIKGGVGKTSTAVNLAYLAARSGRRVLLWDLDPQGAATFLFRVKPQVKGGGQGLVSGKRPVNDALKATDFDNLDLLPADFSYRNMDLDDAKKRTGRLDQLLSGLADDHDVAFLDCPPSVSLVSENGCTARSSTPSRATTAGSPTPSFPPWHSSSEWPSGARRCPPTHRRAPQQSATSSCGKRSLTGEHHAGIELIIRSAPTVAALLLPGWDANETDTTTQRPDQSADRIARSSGEAPCGGSARKAPSAGLLRSARNDGSDSNRNASSPS